MLSAWSWSILRISWKSARDSESGGVSRVIISTYVESQVHHAPLTWKHAFHIASCTLAIRVSSTRARGSHDRCPCLSVTTGRDQAERRMYQRVHAVPGIITYIWSPLLLLWRWFQVNIFRIHHVMWYVSNVSIIFYTSCLFLHHLPTVLLHFVALLCIFRN
jgi:hypothetical protein